MKAKRINRSYEAEFDVTFGSMLLAFLVSDDPLSVWFQGYVREAGVEIKVLLQRRKLDEATLQSIAAEPVTPEELEETHRQTRSAEQLFGPARDFRAATDPQESSAPLDVRHLMAAYIYRPMGHEGDLVSLRYDRPAWSNGFLEQFAQNHPDELESWREIHRQTFASDPVTVLSGGRPRTSLPISGRLCNSTISNMAAGGSPKNLEPRHG